MNTIKKRTYKKNLIKKIIIGQTDTDGEINRKNRNWTGTVKKPYRTGTAIAHPFTT